MDANPFAQFGFDDGATSGASGSLPPSSPPASGAPPAANAPSSAPASSAGTSSAPPSGAAAANPFAQFGYDDGAPASPASPPKPPAAAASALGPLSNDPQGDTLSGVLEKGAATAAIKGIGDSVGFVKGIGQGVRYGRDWVESKITGETPEQVDARYQTIQQKADQAAHSAGGVIGWMADHNPDQLLPSPQDISQPILNRTGEYVPTTEAGRIGMGGVEAAVGALGPGGGAASGPQAVSTTVRSLPALAGAGAAAQGATDATGSPITGLAVGFGAGAAGHVIGKGVGGAAHAVGDYVAPMDRFGTQQPILLPNGQPFRDETGQPMTATARQQNIAGQQISTAATDPAAVRDNLANGPDVLVPGSTPTTFQQTGDMGLGQLERRVATQNPDLFLQRGADQNAARVDAINSIQPAGSPADVANQFRSIRDQMDVQGQSDIAAAQQRAMDAARAVGGQSSSPEQVGQSLRQPLADARAAAKARESQLWDAVDPSRSMVLPSAPIADAAKSIISDVTPSAKPMQDEEARLFNVAASYGPQTPFREVTDLRSAVSQAMSKALQDGENQSYRRLKMLRGAVEDAIDHAVENQSALDQIAVKRGTMAPEETIGARLAQEAHEYSQTKAGRGAVARAGNDGAGPAAGVFAAPGEEVQSSGGSRNAPGAESVPGSQPAAPTVDEAAAARLKAASAATRERAQTFDEGVVGKVLAPGSRAGTFDRSDAQIGRDIFHPGPTGGEDLRAYLAAGGTREAATEAAAVSMRQAAMRPDGTFDPRAVSRWIQQHETALNELPPEVRGRFMHSVQAQNAYDEVVANHEARQNELRRSAIAPFLGLTDPSSVTRQVGAIFGQKNAVETFHNLAERTAADPAAHDGLRRAVVDYIQGKFMGPEAGTSGAPQIKGQSFSDWFKANRPALRQVFNDEEANKLSVVVNDIQRAQRSINATKLKGGSNTAQDTLLTRPFDPEKSILHNLAVQAFLAGAGHFFAGVYGGGAGWLGSKAVGTLRNAGLTRIDNLVTQAMLHPELAKVLLEKAPKVKDSGTAATLAFRVRQLLGSQFQQAGRQSSQPQ